MRREKEWKFKAVTNNCDEDKHEDKHEDETKARILFLPD